MTDLRNKAVLGTAFHAPQCGEIEVLEDVLIAVGGDGRISAVHRAGDDGYDAARRSYEANGALVKLGEGTYLLPGLVDLHVHAPQYPQLGLALDVPLEVWLQKYTFPLEASYADLDFAKASYSLLVEDLLANGTTTAMYFATIHEAATKALVDICIDKGQRALVGKVAMDNPDECPDYYRDASPEAAVKGTRAIIDYVRAHPGNGEGRVLPVVTPRFIPSCTDAALEGLGALAQECGCHVQTHCSESDWAHGYVLARHGMSDCASLDRLGLLGRRTVLAHSNFLSGDDMERLAGRHGAVAHCPLSNAYFAGSVFPVKTALEKGVHVGLGTDISGGPSASLFENIRGAVLVSRMLESGVHPELASEDRGTAEPARLDFREAFYLATAGGGVSLDLDIGIFHVGFHFDALVVDTRAPTNPIRLWPERDTGDSILQRIIYAANRANVARCWVGGVPVSGGGTRTVQNHTGPAT